MATTGVVQEQIEYLLERRVPGARAAVRQARKSDIASLAIRTKLAAVRSYDEELKGLTETEIAERYKHEKEKEFSELRKRAESDERQRFFNQPHVQADFEYWAKARTLDTGRGPRSFVGKGAGIRKLEEDPAFLPSVAPSRFNTNSGVNSHSGQCHGRNFFDPVLPTISWPDRD